MRRRSGKWPLRTSQTDGFCGGQQERLTDSAAGMLLLSTLATSRRDGLMRRLNAEAAPDRKFSVADMAVQVQACQEQGIAHGVAGFGSIADITAMLLPEQPANQPLVIGLVYEPSEQVNAEALRQTLADAVSRCSADYSRAPANVEMLVGAA